MKISRTFICENGIETDVILSKDITKGTLTNGMYLKRNEKNWNTNFYLTKLDNNSYEVSSNKGYSKTFSNFSQALKDFRSCFN